VNLQSDHGLFHMDVMFKGQPYGKLSLKLPGRHNAYNALAATALLHHAGVEPAKAMEALGSFTGTNRRMTLKGQASGVTVVDDYAHHPTEIQVTLRAIRDFYQPRRLVCVFQPHQHSRTRFLLKDFARCFGSADEVVVPDIYFVRDSAREKDYISSEDLVAQIRLSGGSALYLKTFEDINRHLKAALHEGDLVVITMLLAFFTAGFLKDDYVVLYSILSVFCLIFSICLHWISDWNFGSAFYALYGFMAMSIAFYGLNRFPGVCLFLSIQSLIVVSMALWFRNRLIIVMNSLLFLSIIFIYLAQSRHDSTVNFSFALVSFISARVINWKKERLQIKTDLIRNLYMIEGFIMMLYALFHAVPKQYITLSWALAALVYFFVGSMLKNIKYRYLSLGTLICAALYFFIVDLAKIDIIYRVMALLLLAAISIGISMYYSLHLNKTDKKVTLDHR
jgi:hypothetical protein